MGPLDVVVAILRAWFSLAEPVVNKWPNDDAKDKNTHKHKAV